MPVIFEGFVIHKALCLIFIEVIVYEIMMLYMAATLEAKTCQYNCVQKYMNAYFKPSVAATDLCPGISATPENDSPGSLRNGTKVSLGWLDRAAYYSIDMYTIVLDVAELTFGVRVSTVTSNMA
jgi:hypothetical protein